jgi:hypothetical protein
VCFFAIDRASLSFTHIPRNDVECERAALQAQHKHLVAAFSGDTVIEPARLVEPVETAAGKRYSLLSLPLSKAIDRDDIVLANALLDWVRDHEEE